MRSPGLLRIGLGLSLVIGSAEAEARARKQALDAPIVPAASLAWLESFGVDLLRASGVGLANLEGRMTVSAEVERDYFVSIDWMTNHLDDVRDGRIVLVETGAAIENGIFRSTLPDYANSGHIPGAIYADLFFQFSSGDSLFGFTAPQKLQFQNAAAALGITPETETIVYDRGQGEWASRFLWLFAAWGHQRVRLLDGGLQKWTRGGGALETGINKPRSIPRGPGFASYDAGFFSSTKDVLDVVEGKASANVICALPAPVYRGDAGTFPRKGHIPGSGNISYLDLLNEDNTVKPDAPDAGAADERKIIYCGAGIVSALLAVVLKKAGHKHISIYDGSLREWTADEKLPLEVDGSSAGARRSSTGSLRPQAGDVDTGAEISRSTEPAARSDVDVLVIGGGPVGLATALLLGREGVTVELIEKRESTTVQPKGQAVNAATLELYAQWGLLDRVLAEAWPLDRANGQALYDTLKDGEIASFRRFDGSQQEYLDRYHQISPQLPRSIPAFVYEAALRERAERWETAKLSFATEAVALDSGADHVDVVVRDTRTRDQRVIRAKYVVAADGGSSWVRKVLQVAESIGPDFSQQIVTEFKADLDRYVQSAPYFHIFIARPGFTGWFGSKQPNTELWRYNFANPDERLFSKDELEARIRGAIGDPDIAIEIVRSNTYRYTTAVTRQWRSGRVFFVGDSAHRHSVWGGFGNNLGTQDANNIAWKLAAVLRGAATDALLDTYEVERKPRAIYAVKLATYNALHHQAIIEVDQFTSDDRAGGGGDFVREFWGKLRGTMQGAVGIEFGAVYRSAAVVSDGTTAPVSPSNAVVESATPGVRAPHVWLRDPSGRKKPLFDYWSGHFVLLVNGASSPWLALIDTLKSAFNTTIAVHEIGRDGGDMPADGKWSEIYGLEDGGAVLIRPDGFIGARFKAVPDRPDIALRAALRQILANGEAVQ